MRNTLTFFLILFFGIAVNAQETKVDNSQNSCSDYIRLKREVDDVVVKILYEYERDYVFISKFKKAQLAWEKSRDAQLEMIFPSESKGIYGASYPTCRCNHLVDMANERLHYLVRWISSTDESKECGGSVNSEKRKNYLGIAN